MRIVYIGNFIPKHSTENHLKLTLEDLGHTVLPVQEDKFKGIKSIDADLLLWTRTWRGFVTQDDLDRCKQLGITTVSIHLDLYVGISRELAMDEDPFWNTDFVFSPDGDPRSAELFKRKHINHHWLPAGVFKPECKRGTYQEKYATDIAFIGTVWNYHNEWPYRVKLIDFLQRHYGMRFRHYGQRGRPGVRNQDLNDLLASTKVVIGDSLVKGFKHEKYWSDRVYETTGRGGFIIHPYVKGLETQFEIPKELVCYKFDDFDTLVGLIDFYINNPEIREKIRARSMKRTRHDHTYHNRMREMLEVIRG